jgi:hypothetical protein
VVSFTSWPLYPLGKSPWCPFDRRLGEPKNWSGRCGEEKSFQPLPGLEPPIIKPVAQHYTTELSRLLNLCFAKENKLTGGNIFTKITILRLSFPPSDSKIFGGENVLPFILLVT